jgi:TRAP-type C4-dicarboxylate transport system substrate-binding protein
MHELVVSHYMPHDHGTHADFIAPWAAAVERESAGALRVIVHAGDGPLGKLENQYAQVTEGVVDVAHSPAHLPPGRFPRTSLVGLPFMAASTAEATWLLLKLLFDGALHEEFAGLHVLALHADSGALLHTRHGPVTQLEALAGLRIRSPNAAVSAALACLGAVPVQLAPPEIRAAADEGALDGAVMAWDLLAYSGTADIFRFHLDNRVFFAPLYFVMNGARYAALPPAAKVAVDWVSGLELERKFPGWWAQWEAPGRAHGEAPGHHVSRLDPAEWARWQAGVQPAIDSWLDTQAASAPDIRAVHAAARRLLTAPRHVGA